MNGSSQHKKIWTIIDLITWGTSYLDERTFTDARLTIELLLAHVLKFQRIQLYTNFDRPLDDSELAYFKELLKRRLTHEPIQYIIGETEFMGLKFSVDPRVLIPRPDTEIVVESAIKELKRAFPGDGSLEILEIGTGSGCIAVSLAKLLPSVSITAIDVNENTIAVASGNAERNGVGERISFNCADYLKGYSTAKKFHCIVSNPPYISTHEYQLLSPEVRDFEPRSSLTDEGDGLEFYRAIAKNSSDALVTNGFVIVEHAYDQSESVQKVFSGTGFEKITAIKDYGGQNRCVVAHKKIT